MFRKKTVFIVGAGASKELGFPLGYELAKAIRMLTHLAMNDQGKRVGPAMPLLQSLRMVEPGAPADELERAASIINRGVTYSASIDDFLSVHENQKLVVRLGKIAIVRAFIEAEARSFLKSVNQNSVKMRHPRDGKVQLDTGPLEETWLLQLSQMLIRGHTRDSVRKIFQNVAFVTFNYERSLEVFLLHAVMDAFAIDENEAQAIVGSATIVHMYGSIGSLTAGNSAEYLPFGAEPDAPCNYPILADRIRTYGERHIDRSNAAHVHGELHNAEQIVFLGFAFHPQNMKLLKPGAGLREKTIIATSLGMSELDVEAAKSSLDDFFDPIAHDEMTRGPHHMSPRVDPYHFKAQRCVDLMREYALTLTGE